MAKYGAPTPKRELGWSNDETFMREIVAKGGYLSQAEKARLGKSMLATVGVNWAGKRTYSGVAKKLKNSQPASSVEHTFFFLCKVYKPVELSATCYLKMCLQGATLPRSARRSWKYSAIVDM